MVTTTNAGLTPFNVFSNPFPGRRCRSQSRAQCQLSKPIVWTGTWHRAGAQSPCLRATVEFQYPAAAAGQFSDRRRLCRLSRRFTLYFPNNLLDQLPPQDMALGSQLLQSVPNPFYGKISNGALAQPTITYNQLLRPYPQFNGVNYTGDQAGDSIYQSFQLKLEKRFGAGGSLLLSYTNSKLISDVDSYHILARGGAGACRKITTISRPPNGRSLSLSMCRNGWSSSYVLDLLFGQGKKFLQRDKGRGWEGGFRMGAGRCAGPATQPWRSTISGVANICRTLFGGTAQARRERSGSEYGQRLGGEPAQ